MWGEIWSKAKMTPKVFSMGFKSTDEDNLRLDKYTIDSLCASASGLHTFVFHMLYTDTMAKPWLRHNGVEYDEHYANDVFHYHLNTFQKWLPAAAEQGLIDSRQYWSGADNDSRSSTKSRPIYIA